MGNFLSSDSTRQLSDAIFNSTVSIKMSEKRVGETERDELKTMERIEVLIREPKEENSNELERLKTKLLRCRAHRAVLRDQIEKMEDLKFKLENVLNDYEFVKTMYDASNGLDTAFSDKFSVESVEELVARSNWQSSQLEKVGESIRTALGGENRAVDPEALAKLNEEIDERMSLVSASKIPSIPMTTTMTGLEELERRWKSLKGQTT